MIGKNSVYRIQCSAIANIHWHFWNASLVDKNATNLWWEPIDWKMHPNLRHHTVKMMYLKMRCGSFRSSLDLFFPPRSGLLVCLFRHEPAMKHGLALNLWPYFSTFQVLDFRFSDVQWNRLAFKLKFKEKNKKFIELLWGLLVSVDANPWLLYRRELESSAGPLKQSLYVTLTGLELTMILLPPLLHF